MKKSGTINRITNSKIFWIVFSLLASFLVWAYMAGSEDTTIKQTFYNVPVVFQGAENLRSTRGLIITNPVEEEVTVVVRGPRASVGSLHASELQAVVDVSGISQAREMQMAYTIQFPDRINRSGISIENKSPELISFSVVQENSKTIEVKGIFNGSVADGYTADPIVVEPSTITLYGPESELSKVSSACVYLDRQNVNATVGPVNSEYVLLDVDGNEITPDNLTTDRDTVSVTLPILMNKELQLKVNLIAGGGATEDNCLVTIEPSSILVTGDTATLANLNQIVIGTINLADFEKNYENTFTIQLDNNLRNLSGNTEASVKVTISGMDTKRITATNIMVTGAESSGVNATLQTTMLEVIVRASEKDIADITADNIRIVADLSDYDGATGTISVPVKVYVDMDGDKTAGAVGAYSVTVRISR